MGPPRTDATTDVNGDARADAALYERHATEWMRFATTLAGPSGAEDLLATAVLKAMSSPGWTTVENKRAYVYRVITNQAHKDRRTLARRLDREITAAGAEQIEPPDTARSVQVLRALRRLTPRQRAVVHLTYWADLSPDQIADLLHASRRTVERDLTNARAHLEELLS